MATTDIGRERLRRARERLAAWTFEARDRAYAELFEGEGAVVTDEELALLDRIDSALTRQRGSGLWDADEYGVLEGTGPDADGAQVVCIYHPEIPYEGYRGRESLDEATREELNDVLWEYGEQVARHLQGRLEAFLEAAAREAG